ncbi:MAG: hypothetical protein AAF850_13255, partial [Pseudomonadota bacterium]
MSEEFGAPTFPLESCARVAVTNEATGEPVIGAEDFALDVAGERIVLSAYDRLAVERSVRRRDDKIPEGGLYVVSTGALVAALASSESSATTPKKISVRPIFRDGEMTHGLRPHGLTIDKATGDVVFINHAYLKDGTRWRRRATLERASLDGAIVMGAGAQTHCAANNLVTNDFGVLTSFDHAHCGWRSLIDDALPFKRSGVAASAGTPVFAGARFANGVANLPEGRVALADTRGHSIFVLDAAMKEVRKSFDMPGGPDNLTLNHLGALVAALHPSTWRIALYRKLNIGLAPSRVVALDPKTGETTLLFEDKEGAVIAGATVALQTAE